MPTQFPDYRLMYGGQQPNTAQQIGQVASMAGSVPSPIAPALQGVGLLASLYGSLSANGIAEKNYQLELKRYQDELKRQEEDRKRLEDAQSLSNIYSAANYANETGQQNQPRWAQYYRNVRA